jgi:hypothetical protein
MLNWVSTWGAFAGAVQHLGSGSSSRGIFSFCHVLALSVVVAPVRQAGRMVTVFFAAKWGLVGA